MELGDVDLADLLESEAGLAGQGAEDVAGADLFLAPAEDLQGFHRRLHQATRRDLQVVELLPFEGIALHLLDAADPAHLVEAGQAQCQPFSTGPPGAADAVRMHFHIGRHLDIDDAFELGDVEAACRHIGGHQH